MTALFCDKYVDRRSRTHDQMVQAARSGCQNLQEGSVDSATSKKIELKLTGIAKGSLMELQSDCKKFLKHRDLPEWPPRHPALMRFKALQCATLEQFRAWVAGETRRFKREQDTGAFPAVCAANGALSLLNLCIHLVGRPMEAQAEAFEKNGGFTERLCKRRPQRRSQGLG